MSTTPLPLPQFGAKIKAQHPEYADMADADVGAKVLAKFPQYSDMVDPKTVPGYKAPLTAPPAPQKSWLQGQQDEFDRSTQTSPSDSLPMTALKRSIAGIEGPIVHPLNTLKSLLAAPQESGTDLVNAVQGKAPAQGPVQGRIDEAKSDYQQGGLPYAATKGAADIGSMVVGGKVLDALAPAAAEGTAAALNATGRGLKRVGATTSRLAIGAPAAADAMGADAGTALAANRITGLTKRSLTRKVAATVGPASEARDAILVRSDAAPTNVQPLTQAPFDDISEAKTDAQTGAVQPGAMGRMNTTRRAIQQVQDPETGAITDTPKDLNLTPAQMGKLQTNVYDMTDYQSPESTLSNQYTKSVGARLKGAINAAAPEAETATDNIHDLLGAQEHLKSTTPAPLAATDLGLGKMAGHLYDAARVGGGTTAGAGLDLAGTGLMKAGGALRRAISDSPVAPVAQTPSAKPQGLLEANTPTDAQTVGPEDLDKGGADGFQRSPSAQTPPAPPQRLGLPGRVGWVQYSHGMDIPVGNLHPGIPNPRTALTRIQPTEFAPSPTAPAPRGLIADPDGTIRPQPYPLGPGDSPAGLLESTTGRGAPSTRPSLLAAMKQGMGNAAKGDQLRQGKVVAAGRRKLSATPEGLPEQPNIDPDDVEEGDMSVHSPFELLHGTKGKLASIIQSSGIEARNPVLGEGLPKGAYLTSDRNFASQYAHMRARDFLPGVDEDLAPVSESDTPALVKVRVPRKTLLRRDPDVAHLTPSDAGHDSVFTPNTIPPGAVTGVEKLPQLRSLEGMDKLTKPYTPPEQSATRLPDPTDVDGWERLVDEGKAQYNTSTHQYDYTGPVTRRSLKR